MPPPPCPCLLPLYIAMKRVSTLAALFNAQGQTRLYEFFSRPFSRRRCPLPPPQLSLRAGAYGRTR